MEDARYEGKCLCGGVVVRVSGSPLTEGYCHCESCRQWHAAPINAWALWKSDRMEIVSGESLLSGFDSGTSFRFRCSRCGSGLFNRKARGVTVVYADVLRNSGYSHEPRCHIHCDESVMTVEDGLPRYVDMPKEWGGSGELVD